MIRLLCGLDSSCKSPIHRANVNPRAKPVERLTLEVNFVVTRSKGASGGFEFKVLTFGGLKADG